MFKAGNWMQESVYFYGGGVAIVLLIIGIVAFVGPSRNVTESCLFGEGLECVDFKIGPTGAVISVKNNMAKDIKIESVELGKCKNKFSELEIGSGKTVFVPVDGCDIDSEVFADEVSITFVEKGKVSQNSVTGNVVGRVQTSNIYDALNTQKEDSQQEDFGLGQTNHTNQTTNQEAGSGQTTSETADQNISQIANQTANQKTINPVQIDEASAAALENESFHTTSGENSSASVS